MLPLDAGPTSPLAALAHAPSNPSPMFPPKWSFSGAIGNVFPDLLTFGFDVSIPIVINYPDHPISTGRDGWYSSPAMTSWCCIKHLPRMLSFNGVCSMKHLVLTPLILALVATVA